MADTHPTGVQPWGNLLLHAGGHNIRQTSLGTLSVLPDHLLLEVLSHLDARSLGRAAAASRALYCFCMHDDVWRALLLEELQGPLLWSGTTWREAYLATHYPLASDLFSPVHTATTNTVTELPDAAPAQMVYLPQAVPQASGGGDDDVLELDLTGSAAAAAAACDVVVSTIVASSPPPPVLGKRHAPSGNGDKVSRPGPARSRKRSRKLSASAVAATAALLGMDTGDEATHAASDKDEQEEEENDGIQDGSVTSIVCSGSPRPRLRVSGVYSDLLYQPWYHASMEVPQEWLEVDNIQRVEGISVDEFRQRFEVPNRPVLITDAMKAWPALTKWDRQHLREAFAGSTVVAGSYSMPLDSYFAYCDANKDEMPLYLFDKGFATKAPSLVNDYSVPPHFQEDLFQVLGDKGRPDYRWLIMGPARSGSSFHMDPNATSAWNALVSGSKKWILYPPGTVPPGVHPSPDGAEVATPLSLMEWFASFYAGTKEGKVRPIECVVKPGELLFIPRGWWHAALNLSESVALTQNFVSSTNLRDVLRFLKPGRADLVSGCAHGDRVNLHDRFVSALQQQRPEVWAEVVAAQEAQQKRADEAHRLSSMFMGTGTTRGVAKHAASTAGLGTGSAVAFSGQDAGQGEAGSSVDVMEVDDVATATESAEGQAAAAATANFTFGFQL